MSLFADDTKRFSDSNISLQFKQIISTNGKKQENLI